MNKKIMMPACILFTAIILSACGKKEEAPVIEKPAFGEDVAGYTGFTHLKDYTLKSGDKETVLYLPIDEKAYVGNTTAIANKDGVECEANLNPLYSDEVKNKSVDERLVYTLERDYRDKASEYSDLSIDKIAELGDLGYGAGVSYLIFDDPSKSYYGQWVDHMMFELSDGRIINITLKVDSRNENENTEAVIAELEDYLSVDIPYDPGMLKAKIDGYEPDADEAKKNDSTPVEMGDIVMYVPRGFEAGSTYANLANNFISSMAGVDKEDIKVFIPENMFEEKRSEDDIDVIIIFKQDDVGFSGGEMGKYNDGELSTLAQYLTRTMEKVMPGSRLNGKAERKQDIGYGIKLDGTGLSDNNSHTYDGAIYYIIRGNSAYMIVGITPPGSGRLDKLLEAVNYVYDSAELKK